MFYVNDLKFLLLLFLKHFSLVRTVGIQLNFILIMFI